MFRTQLIPGHNVDRLNIEAGLRELEACGYHEMETREVITYAFQRWQRGEEVRAQCAATDKSFHGIDFTCWLRVLAAAKVMENAHQKTMD